VGLECDYSSGTLNQALSIQGARQALTAAREGGKKKLAAVGSLETLVKVYLSIPKRTTGDVAAANAARLRNICDVLGKKLEDIRSDSVGPAFWLDYMAAVFKKQGRNFDLSTRDPRNQGINAAVRLARCLFQQKFADAYKAAGCPIRQNASVAELLPTMPAPLPGVDDGQIIQAWEGLRNSDLRLWLVIGLARFGGLRLEEISAMRGKWYSAGQIELRDRPEIDFRIKGKRPYKAAVLHPALAAVLAEVAPDEMVVPNPPGSRETWFTRVPQQWLRSNGVGDDVRLPLHRLRGLYADAVLRLTADATLARLEGVRAAQAALGHSSPAVTEKHYLSS
jgi:integrase